MLLILFTLTGCQHTGIKKYPFYGNKIKTEQQVKFEKKLIESTIKKFGNKKKGSSNAVRAGWKAYYSDKKETAMKHFNESWILNPENAQAFYGFGVLLYEQNKLLEAKKIFLKCTELDPEYGMAFCQLAVTHKEIGMDATKKYRNIEHNELSKNINHALYYIEKASTLSKKDKDLAYIFYEWSYLLAMKKNYKKAVSKALISQKYDNQFISSDFIDNLKKNLSHSENKKN